MISSSGSIKVSANATLAVLSVPNTTSLFCKRLQASKASALHEKSKKANPRLNPSFFVSSTNVKSSYFSTPQYASLSFSYKIKIMSNKSHNIHEFSQLAIRNTMFPEHSQLPLSMSCKCYQQRECHYLDLEPPRIAFH